MKKLTAFLLLIPFTLIIGCVSNEEVVNKEANKKEATEQIDSDTTEQTESETVKKEEDTLNLQNYETIVLEEVDENREIKIEYPHFDYEPLDEIISKEMESTFESQKGFADEMSDAMEDENSDGVEASHHFVMTFEEPTITDDFVSIHFDGRISMGVSGMSVDTSINFDLHNNQIITQEDVLKEHGTNLQAISEVVAEKLITDEAFEMYRGNPVSDSYINHVYKETDPSENKYDSFTLDEDGITFYNQYYSIFPNAAGIVGVSLDWDEIDAQVNKSEEVSQETRSDVGTYVNDEYDFTLNIPESWEGKYTVKKGDWHPFAIASYDFQFVYEGKEICNIFSINIHDKNAETGPEIVIAEGNGYLFTYNTIMELPLEFYEGGTLSHLEEDLLSMVNEDVPEIAKSFTLN